MTHAIASAAVSVQAAPNPFAARGQQVAVLIDFENVCSVGCGAIQRVIKSIAENETIAVLRGYGDWQRFPSARRALDRAGVQLMDLPSNSVGKNAADMQLTVDAMEIAALSPSIGKFVIIAGDRDFVSVTRKLRTWGCTVWGYGTDSGSSKWIKSVCNRFEIIRRVDAPARKGAPKCGTQSATNRNNPAVATSEKSSQPPMLPTDFVIQVAWAIRAVQAVESSLEVGVDPRVLTSDVQQREISMARMFQMLRLMDSTFTVDRYVDARKRSNVKLVEQLQAAGVLEFVSSTEPNQHVIRPTTLTRDHQNLFYRPLTFFAAIDESIARRREIHGAMSVKLPQSAHREANMFPVSISAV